MAGSADRIIRTGDTIVIADAGRRITYLNPQAQSVTGWTEREAVGQLVGRVFRIVSGKITDSGENSVTSALDEGAASEVANQSMLIRKDGKQIPVDGITVPVRDVKGNIVGRVLIFRDISARKRAQDERHRSDERIRSVVDTATDGIVTIDEHGLIESFNPAATRIFGLQAPDVIGKNLKLLMPEPYNYQHDEYIANYLRTGEAKIIGIGREVVGRRQDGSTFPMDLAISEFTVDGRRHFTGIVRDITERKKAEAMLREQAELLQMADRRKNEFMATLAHELRNPLAPIRNAMQVLSIRGTSDPTAKWCCEVIDRQMRNMARLLDDLLDVSRITYNKLELRKEHIELSAIVENAVETTRPVIDYRKQDLTVVTPARSVYLDADPVRLSQVLSNLLNNAAKYTSPGGHVRLNCERRGAEVVISVKDDGIGIAADVLPHVFDAFSQAKQAREHSQEGLGIGLSLARGLVELHGGSIEAQSDGLGKGSEFIVRLPIAAEQVVPKQAPMRRKSEQPIVTKRRILIVDDLRDSADSLALLLKMTGHEVHTAYNGEDAFVAAEKYKPDVVLLDIGMPKLNGYDTCYRIRQQPWGKSMHLVATTGWAHESDRSHTREAGFDRHLVKPVDPAELIALLDSLRAEQRSSLH